MSSGEWLSGDIVSMYDDELEFDSQKLGYINFEWREISELRSRYDKKIRLAGGRLVQGFLIIKNGHLTLISEGTSQRFSLNDLLSITSSADSRSDMWMFDMSIGLDFSRGNTQQVDYIISASAQRKSPFSRFKTDLIANYSKVTIDNISKATVDSSRFTASWDWFYTANVFFRVFDYEHFTDLQQSIKYRNVFGASAGYHLVNNKRLQWDITLGPSYQFTEYDNQASTSLEKSAVVAFSTLIDYNMSRKVDYLFDYQLQFVSKSSGQRNHHLKTGFDFEVTHNLDVDLSFYLDRVARPLVSIDNKSPQKNDYRLAFSLKYKY